MVEKMEIVLKTQSFSELTFNEYESINGGGLFADVWNEVCKDVTSFAAGAVVGAKVGSATCTPAGVVVGVVVGGIVNVVWDKVF